MMRTLPLLLIIALASGCLDSPQTRPNEPTGTTEPTGAAEPAGTAEPTAPADPLPPGSPWKVNDTVDAWYLAAFGVPFLSVTVVDGCSFFAFRVPEGTAKLEITLQGGAAVDAQSSEAGLMTFMYRGKGQSWTQMDAVPDEGPIVATVANPAAGNWQVWVWPVGQVVNVHRDLGITMEGFGMIPRLEVQGDPNFC